MAEEKIATVNLRKELTRTPKWKRSKLALKILREKLKKITKTEVKIDSSLNKRIWSKGMENPTTKLRIKIVKIDEKTSRAELI